MKKFLNAGIIGLGVGEQHIEGYNSHPNCKVTKICDFNETKLKDVAERFPDIQLTNNPNNVINDNQIDIISIASFDNYHADQVIQSLKKNKHIFVEKPLCLNREEYKEILEVLKRNLNLKISSNLILRKTPRFINLRNRLLEKKLGAPYLIESSYDYGRIHKILEGWRGKIPFYSVTHGGGIHLLDLMMWITGRKVKSVFAKGTNITTKDTKFKFFDCVESILTFEDGMIGNVISNYSAVIPHGHRFVLHGTLGTFNHGPLGCAYFWDRDKKNMPEIIDDEYPGSAKGDIIPTFIDNILDPKVRPIVSTQEVFDTMSVSLAIEESLSHKIEIIVAYDIISQ